MVWTTTARTRPDDASRVVLQGCSGRVDSRLEGACKSSRSVGASKVFSIRDGTECSNLPLHETQRPGPRRRLSQQSPTDGVPHPPFCFTNLVRTFLSVDSFC